MYHYGAHYLEVCTISRLAHIFWTPNLRNTISRLHNTILRLHNTILRLRNTILRLSNTILRLRYTILRLCNTILRLHNTILRLHNTLLRLRNTILRLRNTILRLHKHTNCAEHIYMYIAVNDNVYRRTVAPIANISGCLFCNFDIFRAITQGQG